METLLLIAGLTGNGKSTIAAALSELLLAPMVDIDLFKRDLVDPTALTESIDPPELRWKYYELALEEVFRLFEEGTQTVILDEMFHVGILRKRIETLCAGRGIRVCWIEVRCPDDLVKERL